MRTSAAGAGAATAARELLAAPPAVGGVLGALDEYPLLLRVEEAAEVLRIGRSLAYELARRYESSDRSLAYELARQYEASDGRQGCR